MPAVSFWKRLALVPVLVFSLWLLTDNDTSDSSRSHHLAVVTALNRHPPCMRVYRSLLELNLMLWGGVISLLLWSKTIGKKMIGHLLFQPANEDWLEEMQFRNDETPVHYLPVSTAVFREEGESEGDLAQLSEQDALDADCDSDSDGSAQQIPEAKYHEPLDVQTLAGVAVDSLILILLSLFFFTFSSAEGGRYVDGMNKISTFKLIALVAAPIFPLLLFLGGMFMAILPWGKRKGFWRVISLTLGAPMYHVTFRDGFIGDIFTSAVRPMQDTAFTTFYLLSGLRGWWKQSYGLDTADLPLENNWLLHTCILPTCMVSPLWWRFSQNLRQCYENKKRWPYLGNALKYFLAAEVAMFGLFDPSRKQSFLWLSCFVGTTLYQIWWDVFMDWELFEIEGYKVRLRKTRIYSVHWIYWAIFGINFVLRFCWTLSFLPPHYLNKAGVLSEAFEGDLSSILNPTIASAEIIRRTLWGFLRVELEAIKVGRKEPGLKGVWSDNEYSREVELQVLKMEGMDIPIPIERKSSKWMASSMDKMNDVQILGELCIYAAAFTSLGMLAAAHRVTM